MAETGDRGGQCVSYAGFGYFGKKFGILFAREAFNARTVVKLKEPQAGCIACWGGGAGHVGVVESWDPVTKLMTYSDSNRKLDEKIIRNKGITVKTMQGYMGKSHPFQGYVKFR